VAEGGVGWGKVAVMHALEKSVAVVRRHSDAYAEAPVTISCDVALVIAT
jgi:hypothetical protein